MTNLIGNPGFETVADSSNKTTNGEFEVDTSTWTAGGHTSSIARTTSLPHSGVACLSVTGDGTTGSGNDSVRSVWCQVVCDQQIPVTPGCLYSLNYYIKISGGSGQLNAGVFVDFYDNTDQLLSSSGGHWQVTSGAAANWYPIPFSITPPIFSAYMMITLVMLRQTTGTAFFVDTVTVQQATLGAGDASPLQATQRVFQEAAALRTGALGISASTPTIVLTALSVNPTQHYYFTGYVRASGSNVVFQVEFQYYDDEQSFISFQTVELGTIGSTATPTGTWLAFATTANVPANAVSVRIDLATFGTGFLLDDVSFMLGGPPGGVPDSLVPFLTSNDRYQVILCPNAGDDDEAPKFRYWYAGPPGWGSTLAADASFPVYHTLDENGDYLGGEIELPFVDLSARQGGRDTEAQIRGLLVQFIPRPSSIDESIPDDYSLGFSGRVEAMTVPNYARFVNNDAYSGIAVSEDFAFMSTVQAQASDTWPNIRTVWLPLRLDQKARAARVILTDIHLVEITKVELLGDLVPGRTA